MHLDRVKLITEMARKRITAKELAEVSGISRATIAGVRGGKSCATKTGEKLAEALGVDLQRLLDN